MSEQDTDQPDTNTKPKRSNVRVLILLILIGIVLGGLASLHQRSKADARQTMLKRARKGMVTSMSDPRVQPPAPVGTPEFFENIRQGNFQALTDVLNGIKSKRVEIRRKLIPALLDATNAENPVGAQLAMSAALKVGSDDPRVWEKFQDGLASSDPDLREMADRSKDFVVERYAYPLLHMTPLVADPKIERMQLVLENIETPTDFRAINWNAGNAARSWYLDFQNQRFRIESYGSDPEGLTVIYANGTVYRLYNEGKNAVVSRMSWPLALRQYLGFKAERAERPMVREEIAGQNCVVYAAAPRTDSVGEGCFWNGVPLRFKQPHKYSSQPYVSLKVKEIKLDVPFEDSLFAPATSVKLVEEDNEIGKRKAAREKVPAPFQSVRVRLEEKITCSQGFAKKERPPSIRETVLLVDTAAKMSREDETSTELGKRGFTYAKIYRDGATYSVHNSDKELVLSDDRYRTRYFWDDIDSMLIDTGKTDSVLGKKCQVYKQPENYGMQIEKCYWEGILVKTKTQSDTCQTSGEATEIATGVEIDPAQFKLPDGYEVIGLTDSLEDY